MSGLRDELDNPHMVKKRLDSLRIERFRQIRELSLPDVGHVNLIVGGNSSGKSTLLDALRLFAARASPTLLAELLDSRGELSITRQYGIQGSLQALFLSTSPGRVLANIFYGRQFPENDGEVLYVGDAVRKNFVQLENVYIRDEVETASDGATIRRQRKISKADTKGFEDPDVSQCVEIKLSDRPGLPVRINLGDLFSPRGLGARYESEVVELPYRYVSPNLVQPALLAQTWDEIVLTEGEELAVKALQIIEPKVLGLAFVQGSRIELGRFRADGLPQDRTAVLKMSGLDFTVPLQSMGEGMVRVLQLVLSALHAKDGFLLVDEFENGLHHSVQARVWDLLFRLTQSRGLQIFATTHSNDCVKAFSQVALANCEVDGKLMLMERMPEDGQTVASTLTEQALSDLLSADIEVRG